MSVDPHVTIDPPAPVPVTASVAGVSTAGRRFGHQAARAALKEPVKEPTLSRISERTTESGGGSKVEAPKSGSAVQGGQEVVGVKEDSMEKVRTVARKTLENKFAVAAVVFLLTAVLLCVLNPPMAQKSSDNPAAPPTRSPQKILMWSSLASVITLLLPYGMCLVKKRH